MVRHIIGLFLLFGLSGCDQPWVYNPLSFECISMPIVVYAPEWKEHDIDILEQRLKFYEIPVVEQESLATFEIVCDPIQYDSFNHYKDTVAKTFYKNYHSSMHFTVTRLATKEVVIDKTVHAVHTLKDSPHVYQDSQIAQANVRWEQQMRLFEQLSQELKSLCEFTLSGNA